MEKKNQRHSDSLASKFSEENREGQNPRCLLMKSPSDEGVRRNLGRNGARFAPDAVEAVLRKMNDHLRFKSFQREQVSFQDVEKNDYDQAMEQSSLLISHAMETRPDALIHLGGGHDHAFPLLKALDRYQGENILVINFDAHCDTRIDDKRHSGTPFRNFDEEASKPFHLVQVGIHEFANSPGTMSPLKRNTEKIFTTGVLEQIQKPVDFVDAVFSSCPFTISEKTQLFISLDCDALSSSIMTGVSAVNHNGLDPAQTLKWIDTLKEFPCKQKVLGIYEYNPLFDDLSQKGARYLAGLIYRYLS